MCGRYSLNASHEEIEDRFDAYFEEHLPFPAFNVSPSFFMPVITNEDTNLLQMLKWGIKPVWYKQKTGLINIRAETLRDKNIFNKLLEFKRCIIPATGFYEWKTVRGMKIPYHVKMKNEEIFSFAGLWSVDKGGGVDTYAPGNPGARTLNTASKNFSIITTEPNSLVKSVHDRMPVILEKGTENDWLNSESAIDALNLLSQYDSDEMEIYRVSTKINNPNNNTRDVIQPLWY